MFTIIFLQLALFLVPTGAPGPFLESNLPVKDTIYFEVVRKETPIGFIRIEREIRGNQTIYSVESEITARFLFKFIALGKEKAVYEDDRLVYSSVFRKINSAVKMDQCLYYIDGQYVFKNKGDSELLEEIDRIQRNLITLLCTEPVQDGVVYSDKFKRMIPITKLGPRKYKVIHPNNDYTIYNYRDGKCVEALVVGSFYKVKLVPSASQWEYKS